MVSCLTSVCRSARPSVLPPSVHILFPDDIYGYFLPNLVYALVLWASCLELLVGKFRQFLTELSAHYINVKTIAFGNKEHITE